jgi:hypothetical protein
MEHLTVEEKLINLGGQVWDKKGRRIYLSKIWKKIFNAKFEYYKTGSLKHAEIDGEKWSNNKASKLEYACIATYYDCEACKFVLPNGGCLNSYIDEVLNKFPKR